MTEDRLRESYQASLRARPGDGAASVVPVEQLEALAAGRLPEAEALPLLDRVMSDEALQREFELLRAVHAAATPATRAAWWRTPALVASSAAVIALCVLLFRSPSGPERPVVRGGAAGITPAAPDGDAAVSLPAELAWHPVPGALRYRVEVLTAEGVPAFSGETRDTSLSLDAGAVAAGATYRWWVEAVTPGGSLRSEPRGVTVRP